MRILVTLFVLFPLLLSAQILEWDPLFATVDDTITIIYDATQGNGELVGESEVYAHTGVLTDESGSEADWFYVKTDWLENTPETRMQSLGNDKWRIRFHIRSYYGIPQNETVTHLAFVFRTPDGSKVGREVDGGDIFLPLSQPGPNLALLEPATRPAFLQQGDSLHILAVASQAVQIELLANDVSIKTVTEDTLKHVFVADSFERTTVQIVASDVAGTETRSEFYYVVNPQITTAPVPEGARDGISISESNEVTLVLHAPHKEFVYVMGDFNEWQEDSTTFMHRTPDGERFWVRLPELDPAKNYRYQYWVNGTLRIADPYTELVLDPVHDPFISEETFPNLPPYPYEETTEIVSVLQLDAPEYEWQTMDYERPPKENLIIYELLIRDFLEDHNYQTLIDTLGYFERLGVNAIELMPVSEFEGNISWGYNSSFYFAPDKYYGPKHELQRFIDEAHKRGIAVILDIVLNHSYGQSPMVRLYRNDLSKSPWFNETSPNPVFSWGFDLDHESEATQQFVDRVTEFWLREYKFDGFRFDFTKGFTNTPGDGSAYDASRIALLKRMADHVWSVDSTAYIILEHFGPNTEERQLADYGMMLWGNSNYNYNEATMGYHDDGKSNFSWGIYSQRGWSEPHLVTYMESHDEERLMYKNLQFGNSSGSYNIKELPTALERIELASAFFYTLPGPKMLWQFGELGYDFSINYDGRTAPKPIRWDYLDAPNRRELLNVVSALIQLKRDHAVFSTDQISYSLAPAFKWIKLNSDTMNVVIVGNFGIRERSRSITFQHAGMWFDYFSGDTLDVASTNHEFQLPPGAYHIYTDVALETPEMETSVDSKRRAIVSEFVLDQNYPNPFNPETTIRFRLDRSQPVSLTIYDIQGRVVTTLVDGYTAAGAHAITWNGRNHAGLPVASGVYVYRLSTTEEIFTRKMVLTR